MSGIGSREVLDRPQPSPQGKHPQGSHPQGAHPTRHVVHPILQELHAVPQLVQSTRTDVIHLDVENRPDGREVSDRTTGISEDNALIDRTDAFDEDLVD